MVSSPVGTTLPQAVQGTGSGGRTASAALRRTEYPAEIRELIAQLRQMPGVGPRSAERIALWIVQARSDQPEEIARAMATTRTNIRPCARCGFFATSEL